MRRLRLSWLALAPAAALPLVAMVASPGAKPRTQGCATDRPVAGPAPPPVFVAAEPGSSGFRTSVVLRSASSGAVLRRVASFGDDFTNNGLALSPDRRAIYFTLIPRARRWSNLLIERLDGRSGRRRFVAAGWEPSLSPDGGQLAYISDRGPSQQVVIKNLRTGRTRAIDVGRLAGRGLVVAEQPPGWLGDGTSVALPLTAPAIAVVATPHGPRGAPRARTATSSPSTPMIVVDAKPGHPLSARRLAVRGLPGEPQILSPDASAANTLMAVAFTRGGEAIYEVRVFTSGGSACQLVRIPGATVLAFDGSGRRLLYVLGSRPPALWRAALGKHRLTGRRRLVEESNVAAVAW